jgi:hypothetical protein
MTPRQQKLSDAAEACRNAAREVETDFPRSMLDDPMLPTARRDLVALRQSDVASLNLAANTIMAIGEDADGYATLMKLRHEKRWAFDSCVELARQELERKDDAPPAEQARAA